MEIYLKLGMAFRALIMLIGIPGNTLIVLVYVRKRHKSSTDVYILGLAIADLSVCLVMPLKIYASYNQENYTNSELCKLTHYLSLIGTFLSMFLTICITCDRYFAVCRPLKRFVNPSRARNAVVACFFLAAAIGLVALVTAGIRQYGPVSTCSITALHGEIIQNYSFLILGLYCISLLVIIFMYITIYKTLRNKARTFRQWSSRCSSTQSDDIQAKKNLNLNKLKSIKKTSSRTSSINPLRKTISSLALKDHRIKPQDARVAWESEATIHDSPGEAGRVNVVHQNQNPPPFTIELQDRSVKALIATHSDRPSTGQISEQQTSVPRSKQTTDSSGSTEPEPMISTIFRSPPDQALRSYFHRIFVRAENGGLEVSTNKIHINKYRERIKANNRISKMIFLTTVIYFVTWVPLIVFQCFPAWLIMALFTRSQAGFTIVYMLTLTLNVNHAINPIVYSFVNVRFRRECNATFEWMKRLVIRR